MKRRLASWTALAALSGTLPAAETLPLYIDNDQPKEAIVTIDGSEIVRLAPYEIRRVDQPPGRHQVSASSGDGATDGPHAVSLSAGAVSVFNPGGRASYQIDRKAYTRDVRGRTEEGSAPSQEGIERIQLQRVVERKAHFGPDEPFPLKIPSDEGFERLRLRKSPLALDGPDHAFAVLSASAPYHDLKMVRDAIDLLERAKDPRLGEAAARAMGVCRHDFGLIGDRLGKAAEKGWTPACADLLIAAGAGLSPEEAWAQAFAVVELLVEKSGPEEARARLSKAPAGTLRNLLNPWFEGGRCGVPRGEKARAYVAIARLGLPSADPETRARAARSLASMAEHLSDAERKEAISACGAIEKERRRRAALEALERSQAESDLRQSAAEDTPEGLERALSTLLSGSFDSGRAAQALAPFKKTDVPAAVVRRLDDEKDAAKRVLLVALLAEPPYRNSGPAAQCLLSRLSDADANVKCRAFWGLLHMDRWTPEAEAALKAAVEGDADLSRNKPQWEQSLASRRQQAEHDLASTTDVGTVLENIANPQVASRAQTTFAGRKLSDGDAAKILEALETADDKGAAALGRIFLRSGDPRMMPLAARGIGIGSDVGDLAVWWFSDAAYKGSKEAPFALLDAWRGTGKRATRPVLDALERAAALDEAAAVRMAKALCEEAAKAPAAERHLAVVGYENALVRQPSEKAKKACWKILGDFAEKELSALPPEEAPHARAGLFRMLARIARRTEDKARLKALAAAAREETDPKRKREMEGDVSELERKLQEPDNARTPPAKRKR